MFKKFLNRTFLVLIIGFSLLASIDLLKYGYFPMHDDLQMMRQLMLEKCFLDGQIPCRWVPDMGYGFGYPLFNFYPPFPYLVGSIFRALGFAFTNTARYLFILSFIVSGIGMYLFSKEFFGKVGGFVSAIFYIWAPYHALDIYVRGAMNESWALSLLPFIFLFGYKVVTVDKDEVKKYQILFTVFYSALFLSHNLMLMIFTPFIAIWILIIMWQKNAFGRIWNLIIGGVWALGISSFFTIPALVENKFTWIRSQLTGYYDYTAHFVSIRQLLFSRYWGYGGSIFGTDDGMAFPVGHVHWIISLIALSIFVFTVIKNRLKIGAFIKKHEFWITVFYFVLIGWLTAFFAHPRSQFIWNAVPQLAFLQFPWRFLTLTTFSFSLIAGLIPGIIGRIRSKKGVVLKLALTLPEMLVAFLLVIIVISWNWVFFRAENVGPVTDEQKFSGEAWRIQQVAAIFDYLPSTAEMAPQNPRGEAVEVMDGSATVINYSQGTYWAKFDVNVAEDSSLRLNIFYFPEWRIFANGEEIQSYIPGSEKWGRMWFDLKPGAYTIYAQLFNTLVRTYSNAATALSVAGLLIYYLKPIKKKN